MAHFWRKRQKPGYSLQFLSPAASAAGLPVFPRTKNRGFLVIYPLRFSQRNFLIAAQTFRANSPLGDLGFHFTQTPQNQNRSVKEKILEFREAKFLSSTRKAR
jgi:hypothetical protein